MTERKERISTIEEALENVKDGMCIGLSGLPLCQEPFAMIRALIRKGVKDLTVVALAGGMGIDLMIGAGCVKKVVSTNMAIQNYAPIAPNFRRVIEEGKDLEFWESDHQHWHLALKAAGWGIPMIYTKAGVGTDLPKVNPDLKLVEIDGEPYIAVPPIGVDVCLFHASQADPYGNVIYKGGVFWEYVLARACKGPIIVTVEEIVPNDFMVAEPRIVVLSAGVAADYVIEMPYGAHPDEGQAYYMHDGEHVMEYVAAAEKTRKKEDPSAFQRYLEKYIYGPKNHEEYLERIGGIRRLLELRQSLI